MSEYEVMTFSQIGTWKPDDGDTTFNKWRVELKNSEGNTAEVEATCHPNYGPDKWDNPVRGEVKKGPGGKLIFKRERANSAPRTGGGQQIRMAPGGSDSGSIEAQVVLKEVAATARQQQLASEGLAELAVVYAQALKAAKAELAA